MVQCAPLEAAEGADVLVVLTEWNAFRALDLKEARQVMRGHVLVDLRNVYRKALADDAGLLYFSIGRPAPIRAFANARRRGADGTIGEEAHAIGA
jgi:hypothetical protein